MKKVICGVCGKEKNPEELKEFFFDTSVEAYRKMGCNESEALYYSRVCSQMDLSLSVCRECRGLPPLEAK